MGRQDVLTTQQAARLLGCSRQHVVDRQLSGVCGECHSPGVAIPLYQVNG